MPKAPNDFHGQEESRKLQSVRSLSTVRFSRYKDLENGIEWETTTTSTEAETWGCSSVGRAPALQAGGQRFEPAHLHHYFNGLIAQLVRARA